MPERGEIDDLMASIERLVADEARARVGAEAPEAGETAAAPVASPVPAMPGGRSPAPLLRLGPELRVDPAGPARAAAPSEEELRRIVTQVVRQELAGPLGERVTRNLRRLVRREIRQILVGEDPG
jgi:hypothetical protein